MKHFLTEYEKFQLETIKREQRAAEFEYLLFAWIVVPFALAACVLACVSIFS